MTGPRESRLDGCCTVGGPASDGIDAERAWLHEAIRKVEADANRSADTHLHVFPLPPDWGVDLYLKDESVHPTGSLKHRLARSLFLYALCNGWIGPEHHDHRGVLGLDRGVRGVLRPAARAAVRRGDAAVDVTGEDRADRVPGRPLPPGRRPRHDLRRVAAAGRGVPAGTTWTSSPTPSGPPTGAATTTSPSRSSPSSPQERHPGADLGRRGRRHRRHVGDHRPLRPLPPAARPGCAWSTRRTRRSSPAGSTTTRRPPARRSRIEGIGRPAGGAVVPAVGGGPHDLGARRRLDRRRALVHDGDRPAGRRLDRHRPVGRAAADRRDARRRASPARWSPCSATAGERYADTYYDDDWLAAQGIDIAPYLRTLEKFADTGAWHEPTGLRSRSPVWSPTAGIRAFPCSL